MGLTCLPPLHDYWSTDPYMLEHKVMKELSMMHDHFLFIQCNFHVYDEENMKSQENYVNVSIFKYGLDFF
eukprot:4717749-Ditylum_brightwellii.AAC.1